MEYDDLAKKAVEMMNFSYAPYSRFHVGAALLAKDGTVFTGCNVENAAYGPSNCAERTAVFKAVSEGCREFEAIAIAGGAENADGKAEPQEFCPPCGVCRQVLAEFCDRDFKVILAKSNSGADSVDAGAAKAGVGARPVDAGAAGAGTATASGNAAGGLETKVFTLGELLPESFSLK